MKRKLILFALLIMATGLRAQTLVLHHTDGTTTNVELSKNFRMDVTDADYVITLKDATFTFSRSDISYFTFDQKKGDVNRDGDVGIGDIVAITNIMAGIDTDDEEKAYLTCPDDHHPHWIDLGIGTQWRCCNEGASTPEDSGGHYTFDQAQAYNPPSLEQIEALLDNCSSEWTTQNGVYGQKFTGPNGGTIFLPAAGYRGRGELYGVGSWGYYWSSTSYDENSAYGLNFSSGGADWGNYYRDNELSVRPVFQIMATGLRAQTLVLHHTDGTTTNVELSKNFRMDVTDADYVITLKDATFTFSRSDISYFTFDQKKGDVNRDGDVGIGDIVAITNIMAGIDTDDEEEAYLTCPDDHHPHWIDLGIGTQWRCCNEGASTPEQYGGCYTFDQAQAYNPPSHEQIKELLDKCPSEWTTQNGVNGRKFTGPNGGTIFLPAAGNRWDGELDNAGSNGYYWSSTLYESLPSLAYYLRFYSENAYWNSIYCLYGHTVRPVR